VCLAVVKLVYYGTLQVSGLCELLPTFNNRRTLITPVVGIVDASFEPSANDEVSQVFRLPLDRFLSCKGHSSFVYSPDGHMVHFFEDYVKGAMFSCFNVIQDGTKSRQSSF